MNLTISKNVGGLGSKDLNMMNKALLAKQAWRLFVEPESLQARVIKGMYYHDKNMLCAIKGGMASWMWSSLIEGRDFQKENILWQIVEGEKTSIWDDVWILGLQGKKI